MDLNAELVGNITLNISLVLYLSYLIPQIIHNFKDARIEKLSLMMHFILLFSYLNDLIYGFGRKMPWQYKSVSFVGLICLFLQHFQIAFLYKFKQSKRNIIYLYSFIAMFVVVTAAFVIKNINLFDKSFFINIGFIAQVGWLTYTIPQIFKNYHFKTTKGISILFSAMILLTATCDTISSYTLNWDLPNKIGAPASLIMKIILFSQFFIYSSKVKNKDQIITSS